MAAIRVKLRPRMMRAQHYRQTVDFIFSKKASLRAYTLNSGKPSCRSVIMLRIDTVLIPALSGLLLSASAWAVPAHYLVIREAADGVLTVVSTQRVDLAEAAQSAADLLPAADRLQVRLPYRVVDKASGQERLRNVASTPRWQHAEFADAEGVISGQHLEPGERFYVLRLPVQAGQRLELAVPGAAATGNGFAGAPRLSLDLDGLTPTPGNQFAAASTGVLIEHGDPANRLDLLVVGDGYTAAQQSKFQQDAAQLSERFLSLSPYRDYRNLVNVSYLFVASSESGASKPACAETPSAPVVAVKTAFNSSYCSNGLRRLIGVNTSAVLSAAAAVPNWDEIILLVNDTEYGGSGGRVAVASLHALAVPLIQHEFAHTFTLLADEYDTAYPGFPSCSDLGGNTACEPNVTDDTRAASIKWRRWIVAGTPLPTTAAPTDAKATGLWRGARFLSSGMYRQCYNGIMRTLASQPYFCNVDAEAFVLRLYKGGWGAPQAGVRNIEPKSLLPAAGAVTLAGGTCQNFQATLAGPEGTAGLTANWLVNGQSVKSSLSSHGALESNDIAIPASGTVSVALQVTDNTPLALDKPVSRADWTVSAGSGGRPDAPRLFAWAEAKFPTLFAPAGAATQSISGYEARYYAASNTWLGIKDCRIFVLGDAFGGLLEVGAVSRFIGLAGSDGF